MNSKLPKDLDLGQNYLCDFKPEEWGLTCVWCSRDEAGQEAAVERARPALPHHSQTRAHDTAVPALALHTHTGIASLNISLSVQLSFVNIRK